MNTVRQRMLDDMQFRGLSPTIQRCYIQAVHHLARYCNKSLALISEEELRQYFLYLRNDKRVSRSTSTVALCAIKFLFEHTLHRSWPVLAFIRPPKQQKLPVVLIPGEMHAILGAVRRPHYPARKRTEATSQPMAVEGQGRAFRAALAWCGIHKAATVHTLRHSWPTNLLESGVNLRVIQTWLGHASPSTTALYTHLTGKTEAQATAAINQLLESLV